jgi:hypothetical protein
MQCVNENALVKPKGLGSNPKYFIEKNRLHENIASLKTLFTITVFRVVKFCDLVKFKKQAVTCSKVFFQNNGPPVVVFRGGKVEIVAFRP